MIAFTVMLNPEIKNPKYTITIINIHIQAETRRMSSLLRYRIFGSYKGETDVRKKTPEPVRVQVPGMMSL